MAELEGEITETEEVAPAHGGSTIPKDIFSDVIPDAKLPLDDETIKREYASIPNSGSKTSSAAPPSDSGTASATEGSTSGEAAPGSSPDGTAPAPGAEAAPGSPPMTPEEQHQQAAMTVDMFLNGYEKIHALGRWAAKMSDEDLMVYHAQGKINLEQVLPIGNKTVSLGQFFQEYNQGVEQNITVSNEFKEKFTPPAIRECIKRGWFVSDFLYCCLLLADDLSVKTSLVFGLKKSASMVLKSVMDLKKKQDAGEDTTNAGQRKSRTTEESTEDTWHRETTGEESQPQ